MAIKDWVRFPEAMRPWAHRADNWLHELTQSHRAYVEQDGAVLFSATASLSISAATETAFTSRIAWGSAEMPVFDFPTTLIVTAIGQYGFQSVANSSMTSRFVDGAGAALSVPASATSFMGPIGSWDPYCLLGHDHLNAGEQAEWDFETFVSSGNHYLRLAFDVKIVRGHMKL